MPYIYHGFTSAKADSTDTTLVRPSNWNARLQYSNLVATGPGGSDAFVREVLTANRTYYVRADGSDSNNGLTDTSGGAFLTGEYAITVLQSLDFNTKNVTLHFGNGTWTGFYVFADILGGGRGGSTGNGGLTVEGNGSANTTIQLYFDAFTNASVQSMTLSADAGDGFASLWAGEHAEVAVRNDVVFHSASGCNTDMYTYDFGAITIITSGYTISGSGTRLSHARAQTDARFGYSLQPVAITIADNPNFSTAFFRLQDHAQVDLGNSFTSSGACTGKKFTIIGTNITLVGATANIPGSLAGTITADAFCAAQIRANVTQAPRTVTAATDTLTDTDYSIIANFAGTVTLTLPTASSFTNRELQIKTITANTVVSATSNVVPLIGGGAGTAILSATAGRHARLQSDGTNWVIMSGVT